jgi:ATP-dependent Lon protease
LLPAQLLANGLAPELFSIAPAVLLFVVTNYTREAGVRSLDRAIGSLVRGKVVEYSSARDLSTSAPSNSSTAETTGLANYRKDVEEDDVRRILGNEFYAKDDEEIGGEKGEDVGVALGLAYMGSGNGGTLCTQSLSFPTLL